MAKATPRVGLARVVEAGSEKRGAKGAPRPERTLLWQMAATLLTRGVAVGGRRKERRGGDERIAKTTARDPNKQCSLAGRVTAGWKGEEDGAFCQDQSGVTFEVVDYNPLSH